jgi:hypothetical protein
MVQFPEAVLVRPPEYMIHQESYHGHFFLSFFLVFFVNTRDALDVGTGCVDVHTYRGPTVRSRSQYVGVHAQPFLV